MPETPTIALTGWRELPPDEMQAQARQFHSFMDRRRTVRTFSDRPIPPGVIENCLRAAGTAPSGANLQPWHFVVVADPELKRRIRVAAEAEEEEFYQHRAPAEWLEALAPLGTDSRKPFLETAPCLIAIFGERYSELSDGRRRNNYYVTESVGIAAGILLAALHHSGLATLTHTPSPMGFLNQILDRPPRERPFLLVVTGFPASGTQVPDIRRKPLEQIATFK